MPSPSRYLPTLAALALGAFTSSVASAQAETTDCGKTSAAGRTLKVKVVLTGEETQSAYSCTTARGVIRVYRKTKPTQKKPTREVKYGGQKWSCYFIRDSSGYNCFSADSEVDRGTITGLFK